MSSTWPWYASMSPSPDDGDRCGMCASSGSYGKSSAATPRDVVLLVPLADDHAERVEPCGGAHDRREHDPRRDRCGDPGKHAAEHGIGRYCPCVSGLADGAEPRGHLPQRHIIGRPVLGLRRWWRVGFFRDRDIAGHHRRCAEWAVSELGHAAPPSVLRSAVCGDTAPTGAEAAIGSGRPEHLAALLARAGPIVRATADGASVDQCDVVIWAMASGAGDIDGGTTDSAGPLVIGEHSVCSVCNG